MIKNICVRSAAFLALFGAGVAMAQTAEVEPNDTPATAQRLPSGGASGVTVQGEILTAADIDYYAFHAQAGDVLSINIDNGMKTPDMGLHSTVSILGPTGGTVLNWVNTALKGQSDNGSPFVRPGTRDTTWDAKLPTVPIQVSGTYVVAVAGYPTFVSQNGFVAKAGSGVTDQNSHGTYTLIITGANPDPLKIIGIDIKPGDQRLTTPINMKSNGRIPVALLSAPDFDPFLVKQESLRFGHEGTEMSLARCSKDKDDDYNKDGKPDLVCQFYTQSTLFVPTDIEGVLSGEMLDGTKIEGRAPLKVIPADMRHHGDRDGDHDRDHDGKGEHEKEEHSKARR